MSNLIANANKGIIKKYIDGSYITKFCYFNGSAEYEYHHKQNNNFTKENDLDIYDYVTYSFETLEKLNIFLTKKGLENI